MKTKQDIWVGVGSINDAYIYIIWLKTVSYEETLPKEVNVCKLFWKVKRPCQRSLLMRWHKHYFDAVASHWNGYSCLIGEDIKTSSTMRNTSTLQKIWLICSLWMLFSTKHHYCYLLWTEKSINKCHLDTSSTQSDLNEEKM